MYKNIISWIIIGVLILGGVLFGFLLNNEIATHAEIYIHGELYATYPLNEDTEFKIGNEDDYNIIVIKDGKIYVEDADCLGHDCMHMGKKNKKGETIICSPHSLVIKLIRK